MGFATVLIVFDLGSLGSHLPGQRLRLLSEGWISSLGIGKSMWIETNPDNACFGLGNANRHFF